MPTVVSENSATTKVSGPLKWHGGKTYQADWIIRLMPPRCMNPNAPAADDPGWLHYVEPYFGGGAVLLALDPEGISEVVNDINSLLANFWQVLANEDAFAEMQRILAMTGFNQDLYDMSAKNSLCCEVDAKAAAAFFTHVRQSMSGRMKSFAPMVRNRTRRGMQEQVSAWLSAVEGLPEAHERLKRVASVTNLDALKVIKQQDGPRTLFYLDPPYLHETRVTTSEYGAQEMTHDQHHELLLTLAGIKGRFLLSGYPSKLYDDMAREHGWNRHELKIDNKSSSAKVKEQKTEVVWTNFNDPGKWRESLSDDEP
jgi:DNA adenine methylase